MHDSHNLCKKPGCNKLRKNKKQIYCSKEHAPYGNLGENMTYEKGIKKSTFQERGGILSPLTNEGNKLNSFGKTTQYLKPEETIVEERITIPISKENERDAAINGILVAQNKKNESLSSITNGSTKTEIHTAPQCETTMLEINSNSLGKNTQGEPTENPIMDLMEPLNAFEQARSDSMSLINDSASHLHALMKSVGINKEGQILNPIEISAACNCASQIHKLIRLKFDIAMSYGKK